MEYGVPNTNEQLNEELVVEQLAEKQMSAQKEEQETESEEGPGASESGCPSSESSESTETRQKKKIEEIPIGIPMDVEDFKRLKEEAKQPTKPESPADRDRPGKSKEK